MVIAIVMLLAALLLPALNQARTKARNAACISNLRQISLGLFSYADDNGRLPWVCSGANPSTSQTSPFYGSACPYPWSGYGYLVMGRYVGNQRVLYCPDAVVWDGWGGVAAATKTRRRFIETLPHLVASNIDARVDYNLGWWDGAPKLDEYERGQGYGRAAGGRRVVYWTCDDYGAFPYYYRVINHADGLFMNLGRVDGGVDTIYKWRDKQPTSGNYGYYYPYNDRPGWGFWRYFGTGQGVN